MRKMKTKLDYPDDRLPLATVKLSQSLRINGTSLVQEFIDLLSEIYWR